MAARTQYRPPKPKSGHVNSPSKTAIKSSGYGVKQNRKFKKVLQPPAQDFLLQLLENPGFFVFARLLLFPYTQRLVILLEVILVKIEITGTYQLIKTDNFIVSKIRAVMSPGFHIKKRLPIYIQLDDSFFWPKWTTPIF